MADPSHVAFDVTFTDGAVERVTVEERVFADGPLYAAPGDMLALSHERAASRWAGHQMSLRSIDGEHTTGIASIARADDWRGCPSAAEALAHNGRTGGDCFGPWLWREHDDATVVVRMVAVRGDDTLDIDDDLSRDGQWRPITRAGAFLLWPTTEAR